MLQFLGKIEWVEDFLAQTLPKFETLEGLKFSQIFWGLKNNTA